MMLLRMRGEGNEDVSIARGAGAREIPRKCRLGLPGVSPRADSAERRHRQSRNRLAGRRVPRARNANRLGGVYKLSAGTLK
ncbi:hypothetical protein BDV98DRAFT_558544 [Pterulicium gracile]|uniref:Uncharacterized protein n=1 Tax=Pterulicium gracile TaxID=1884261 RepID=A0A5C3R0V0_9AGAR|nr:hypothetical protein BDV98DRAFT_558544 [Pterula gracilis]